MFRINILFHWNPKSETTSEDIENNSTLFASHHFFQDFELIEYPWLADLSDLSIAI
jgi:hypothetical protein